MMDFLLYAIASFYFILSNLDKAATAALSAVGQMPLFQANETLKMIDTTVKTQILPNRALRLVTAAAFSLMTYPLVLLANYTVQLFVYWLALLGFVYLSVAQNEFAYKFVTEKISQLFEQLKLNAPQQFQKLIALFPAKKIVAEIDKQTEDENSDGDEK